MDARVGEVRAREKMTKAARIRMAWWNTVYLSFGLFSMLEAPMLAIVRLTFLNRLALIVRESDLMTILFLQGIASITYSPLNIVIKVKYTNIPYETHKLLFLLYEVSYMLIIIGFISLVVILFLNVDGLPRNSTTYLELRAALVGAIVLAPLSLTLVYFTPSEHVGPVAISAVLLVVILAVSYVEIRRVQTGRQTRRQRRV